MSHIETLSHFETIKKRSLRYEFITPGGKNETTPFPRRYVSHGNISISSPLSGSLIRLGELIQLQFPIKGRSGYSQRLGSLRDIIVHHLERVDKCLAFYLFKRQNFR